MENGRKPVLRNILLPIKTIVGIDPSQKYRCFVRHSNQHRPKYKLVGTSIPKPFESYPDKTSGLYNFRPCPEVRWFLTEEYIERGSKKRELEYLKRT